MSIKNPEVFEVYRTKEGTLEKVVLLADYEALQAEVEALVGALEQAGLALHEMDDGHAALVDIDNAMAAYRK